MGDCIQNPQWSLKVYWRNRIWHLELSFSKDNSVRLFVNSPPVLSSLWPPYFYFSHSNVDKDNASQSSTDTAISSESPTRVKREPAELTAELNGVELHIPDVSPRKKPRKQLLWVVISLSQGRDWSRDDGVLICLLLGPLLLNSNDDLKPKNSYKSHKSSCLDACCESRCHSGLFPQSSL